ncbi:MAG: VWA domain-containing protein [Thermoanaerobaculia bacterium]
MLDVRTAQGESEPGTPAPSGVADAAAGTFTEIVDVRVVNLEVFVTNKAGLPVAGLGPADFELEVDGKPMPISNFYAEKGGTARETLGSLTRPVDLSFRSIAEVEETAARRSYVVILVDHTRLRTANRKRAFNAVRRAVEGLDANDLVSVVGVEGRLVFYSDFLYDRGAIGRILDNISGIALQSDIGESERRLIFGELARGMSGGILAQSSQAESDAIISRIRAYAAEQYSRGIRSLQQIEAVVSTLSGVPGRKTLLYVGEGVPTRPGEGLYQEWINRFGEGNVDADLGLRRFDFNTDYTRAVGRYDLNVPMRQLATAANRAGVTMYSIDAEGSHSSYIRSALTEQGAHSDSLSIIDENYRVPLEYASKATGGRLLQSSGELSSQLAEIIHDFDTFYSLGFTAPEDWDRGSDHRIKVKVTTKGLRARHRDQVRLPEPDEREAGATVAALMYQTVDNPLGFRATPGTEVPRQDGTAALPINLEIPIARLGFLPQGDSQAASLSVYVSTRGADGNATRVQKVPFHLPPIPNEVIEKVKTESARYPLPVVLRPGDQHVAIGIRDNVNGEFSAVRVDVSGISGRI